MNKKFSTLAASLLLASAFATSANAQVNAQVQKGDYVEFTKTGSGTLLTVGAKNTLTAAGTAVAGITNTNQLEDAFKKQWQVASVKYDGQTGTAIYQFVNKGTGQYLAVDLKTDNKGESTADPKISGAGNRDWCVDGNGHIYVFKNDSTYTFDKDMRLVARKGAANFDNSDTKFSIARHAGTVALNAVVLNALMDNGKLYFNGKDAAKDDGNIFTSNPWKAYDENTAGNIFLMRADKDSVTSDNRNPRLLMVDTLTYAGGEYLKFVIDTLAISKDNAAKLKDGSVKYNKDNYAPLTFKAARQIETAIFNANYSLYNDSITLAVKAPGVTTFPETVTDFTNIYGYDADGDGDIAVTGAALTAQISRIAGYDKAAAETAVGVMKNLATAVENWMGAALGTGATAGYVKTFATSKFTSGALDGTSGVVANTAGTGVLALAEAWVNDPANETNPNYAAYDSFVKAAKLLQRLDDVATTTPGYEYYHADGYGYAKSNAANASAVALKVLGSSKILTVAKDVATATPTDAQLAGKGYVAPLIQPNKTTGGDAEIEGTGKVYFLQMDADAEVPALRAGVAASQYLVVDPVTNNAKKVDAVDAADVYAQWAFIPSGAGSYQVVNRGSGKMLYAGAVSKGDEADTYVIGGATYKLAGIDLSSADIYDETGTKYDYTGAFYAGPADGVSQSFAIAPASQFLTTLGLQFNKDSVLVLGDATTAPQWYLKAGTPETYGFSVPGLPDLKKVTYQIYTKDAEGTAYYVYPTTVGTKPVFAITKSDSQNAANASKFEFRTVGKDTYLLFVATGAKMATINLNLAEPTIEVSDYGNEGQDYFTILKSEYSDYRTLTAADGVDGNAKIFMENEPNRYLYENTANIVANNGNGIAKDSLNFLGIFNADAMVKNAALYIDTAYVDRKGNTKPLYMIALGVEKVAATAGTACTESGKHFDANGKETTADKCVHATPATKAYKTGRYLVSLKDSVPTGFAKHPAIYDNCVRLAFVDAKHIADTLVISDSKFTGTKNAINDSIKIGATPNEATFALKIKDQATQSFILETVGGNTYVRILNGVPVLTGDIKEAAVFNIEATEENATANEAIAAEGVQVIGGKGAVTVQGAAGKVITVANVLGQTIANQVAASDNVTIAAPAGVVVVAVEGEATKVVVK